MNWLEITVPFKQEEERTGNEKDILLLNLLDLGIQGVWEEDSAYKFYLSDTRESKKKVEKILGEREFFCNLVKDENWAETWKEFWHPNKIARFVIVPSWESYQKADDEIIIDLDPGMAFGTGAHESTALMLELLDNKNPSIVWDIGTGTGILAIAAALLGAKVYAFDIDPLATDAAKENAQKNNVNKAIEVIEGDLLKDANLFPKEFPDLVFTNIIAEVIVEFIPILKEKIPHFTWLLSGIITPKASMVIKSLEEHGFSIKQRVDRGEWVALEAVI